jgi:hypothetical protein
MEEQGIPNIVVFIVSAAVLGSFIIAATIIGAVLAL